MTRVIIRFEPMPKFFTFLFFIFICFDLKAQTWELGGSLGGAGYMGELNLNNPLKVSGFSIGGFVQRNFDGYFSAKIGANFATISGNDSNSSYPQVRSQGLNFTTTLYEASIMGEFNFLYYVPEAGKNKFTPYIFLGAAAASYYPSTVFGGKTYDLRGYETEGEKKPYPTTTYSIPYGAGVKYNILGKWTLAADLGYRNTNTGYLDDVSGFYSSNPSFPKLSNPSGSPAGSQRGSLNTNDTYFFIQFSLSYTFVTEKCYFH